MTLKSRLEKISPWLVISDIDGVMTDGTIFASDSGDLHRRFSVLDGLGLERLKARGFTVGFISASRNLAGIGRLKSLGADFVITPGFGEFSKKSEVERLSRELGCPLQKILFLGDDLPDLELAGTVGIFIAPKNAHPEVKAKADFVLQSKGGKGFFREVSDLLLG